MRKRSSNYRVCTTIILIALSSIGFADSVFGIEQNKGWFFYESKPVESKELLITPIQKPLQTPGEQAESELESLQLQLKQAGALAIMHPTPENVWAYQQLKSKIYDMSGVLTDQEMRNQWSNPDSYVSNNARGGEGLQIDRYAENHCSDKVLKDSGNSYGLYLFTSQNCKYCNAQVSVTSQMSQKYNISAMVIGFNDTPPENLGNLAFGKDNGALSKQFGVRNDGNPVTVLLNVKTGTSQILGYGYIPLDDLSNRICRLYTKKVGEF